MPFNARPVTSEKDALVTYLAQQQDAFRSLAHGLFDAQAAAAPSASSLSVGGLIKHVTHVQQGWLSRAVAAPGRADESVDAKSHESGFTLAPGESLADALTAYDRACAGVLDAVDRLDLDTPVPVPDAPWFPKDVEAWSVRWVWFHILEELTRHAGHGDIVRETVDGATMYELVAAHEGLPGFPPFLVPWQPSPEPFTTGVSTVTLYAADPAKARAWYTELLGAEPYFDNGPYVEWRVGPHDHELGLLDAAYAPEHRADGAPSAVTYWQVPDAEAAYARLLSMGASWHVRPRAYGGGYVGASVIDPFGNVFGVMERGLPAGSAAKQGSA